MGEINLSRRHFVGTAAMTVAGYFGTVASITASARLASRLTAARHRQVSN
jgi:secreted PhoX family phosphatase